MSDITLLSKFLFSVEPWHSLLPNANIYFFHARPSMFKHLSSIFELSLMSVLLECFSDEVLCMVEVLCSLKGQCDGANPFKY